MFVSSTKWLMISGRSSWAGEVQSGSDFIHTLRHGDHLHVLTKSHTLTKVHLQLHSLAHARRNTLPYSFRYAILLPPCCLLHNAFPLLSHSSGVRERGGRESASRGERCELGAQTQHALYSFRLCVPLLASMGLFLTAAITTNNWTANEDKWYDCRARPSSQSAI